jgi:hypothetical protein
MQIPLNGGKYTLGQVKTYVSRSGRNGFMGPIVTSDTLKILPAELKRHRSREDIKELGISHHL